MSPIDPRPSWVRQRTYELHHGMSYADARRQAEAEADDNFGGDGTE
jgi:hypothetical protein